MTADPGRALAELSAEVRALAANGLHFAGDPYDKARFERLLEISAELLTLADPRTAARITEEYRGAVGLRTPNTAADAAVFDDRDRLLLVQRADGSATWCMPGGICDVGESPSEAAVRECFEETGLRVEPRALIGLYDNRLIYDHRPAWHLYIPVVHCEVVGGEPGLTHETLDFGWFTEAEATALPLFRGYPTKIADAFRFRRGELARPVLH
ncbi:NUDIX hydrolase N-terminal domain-containing protein [Phytomonospora endophytica]|uniref:8-oxo-dGTP pyrophosphatase MutT (NUDIX family) n=1 Tax=Phytomonospora endophytica TaxID=714109 RepID=A0A841FFF5_9ACTN|nr:NUDIX hydrolase N-terminal domain-containing protein [Phytomonospora endophytica]MBB6034574.1 8-oxo-dGTP pyrophosphatase MutT (NUDIX family) [Phytomonospora endophytica]GIG71366.1 ADP-ribose pyrophosphatase [Phytomonospora endophytica]